MSKHKMMLLATTLIASSLVGCFGGKEEAGNKVDLSAMRTQCMEASGFTGNVEYYPGGLFLWRADNEKVAECEWHDGTFKYVGILGHGHPGDNP